MVDSITINFKIIYHKIIRDGNIFLLPIDILLEL